MTTKTARAARAYLAAADEALARQDYDTARLYIESAIAAIEAARQSAAPLTPYSLDGTDRTIERIARGGS